MSSAVPRRCLACSVLIVDLIHERTRKSAPIEVKPAGFGGNIVVDLLAGTYRLPQKKELEVIRQTQPESLRISHFVNCPAAAHFDHSLRRRAAS